MLDSTRTSLRLIDVDSYRLQDPELSATLDRALNFCDAGATSRPAHHGTFQDSFDAVSSAPSAPSANLSSYSPAKTVSEAARNYAAIRRPSSPPRRYYDSLRSEPGSEPSRGAPNASLSNSQSTASPTTASFARSASAPQRADASTQNSATSNQPVSPPAAATLPPAYQAIAEIMDAYQTLQDKGHHPQQSSTQHHPPAHMPPVYAAISELMQAYHKVSDSHRLGKRPPHPAAHTSNLPPVYHTLPELAEAYLQTTNQSDKSSNDRNSVSSQEVQQSQPLVATSNPDAGEIEVPPVYAAIGEIAYAYRQTVSTPPANGQRGASLATVVEEEKTTQTIVSANQHDPNLPPVYAAISEIAQAYTETVSRSSDARGTPVTTRRSVAASSKTAHPIPPVYAAIKEIAEAYHHTKKNPSAPPHLPPVYAAIQEIAEAYDFHHRSNNVDEKRGSANGDADIPRPSGVTGGVPIPAAQ